jgi:putative oxidoreductase
MSNLSSFYSAWSPRLLSALRIIAAFLFMQHGIQKILGLLTARPAPPIFSLGWIAGVLELFGGLLLMLGLFTRPVAFILSGLMAFAYFLSHGLKTFWPVMNGGELAALYSFLFLYISVAGGGSWSLDNLLQRKRTGLNPEPGLVYE